MRVALFVRNLMFAERIRSAALAIDLDVVAATIGAPPGDPPDVVVVDLGEADWGAAVAWAAALRPRPRILGFGSHVRADLFAAARAAGVDRAVANSRMAEDPASVLLE